MSTKALLNNPHKIPYQFKDALSFPQDTEQKKSGNYFFLDD